MSSGVFGFNITDPYTLTLARVGCVVGAGVGLSRGRDPVSGVILGISGGTVGYCFGALAGAVVYEIGCLAGSVLRGIGRGFQKVGSGMCRGGSFVATSASNHPYIAVALVSITAVGCLAYNFSDELGL